MKTANKILFFMLGFNLTKLQGAWTPCSKMTPVEARCNVFSNKAGCQVNPGLGNKKVSRWLPCSIPGC